jgi:hypothetical protein
MSACCVAQYKLPVRFLKSLIPLRNWLEAAIIANSLLESSGSRNRLRKDV